MPNSQDFDQAANSTLAKLLEVDSQLTVQEAELLSQMESVQEKRRSLKTVISLFAKTDAATTPVEEPAQTSSAKSGRDIEPVDEDVTVLPLETSKAITTAPSSTSRNKTTKSTHPAKANRKGLGWQQYVRDEFSHTSLSEAVSLVLQRQADKVFEIPAIVNTIFMDELPKEVGNKARRQVTNILSEGARKNKWYRGQLGYYSMSRAAAQAK